MTSIAIAADIRNRFNGVRDQGRRKTCLALAASAAHEYAHQFSGHLSVEWLLYHAVKGDAGRANDGVSIPEACETVERDGQPDEPYWPYLATLNPAAWKRPASPPAKLWRAVAGPVGLAGIQGRIDAGSPVVIALSVGSGFSSGKIVEGEFVLKDDPESVSKGEGHALVAVGHGKVDQAPHLLIRNSWGSKWGRGGHAWISTSEVSKRWIDGFELGAKT